MRQDSLPFYKNSFAESWLVVFSEKLKSCYRNYDLFERDSFDRLGIFYTKF